VLGKEWATGTVGVTAAMGHGTTAYASFTGQIGQSNVVAP